MFDMRNQDGYSRMTSSAIILAVMVISVLAYQFFAFRQKDTTGIVADQVAGTSYIQLFPQSLPVNPDLKYVFEIIDEDNIAYVVGKFFHQQENIVLNEVGGIIQDGIFNLPIEANKVISARLLIFDDSNLAQPLLIPFLGGVIKNDRSLLTFNQVDFTSSAGQFMLASPTDNNSLVNERSGLWFGDAVKNQPKLLLPDLPNGWVYEGWALIDEQPLTTGRFKKTNRQDLFSGFSDNQGITPSFPGEDFLRDPPVGVFFGLEFPLDLVGQSAMVTIEPDNNGTDPGGAGPFGAIILKKDISRLAESGKLYDLDLALDTLPKATVVLR